MDFKTGICLVLFAPNRKIHGKNIRERLNIGNVPVDEMYQLGTFPTDEMHLLGTVPTVSCFNPF